MGREQWPVRCDDLVFRYRNGFLATNRVSLTIQAGELYCLLGPNGAGKTTLIRQIVGDLRPVSGQVSIFGVNPARARGIKSRLGIIPQSVGLFEALSVKEHLFHIESLKGLSGAALAASIAKAVEASQIEPLLDIRARALSGGQQRSVLFALAVLGDPDLLILDEPTVGLDPVARRVIWDAIAAQRAAGKAILLTTHYMDEAERLATRIAFFDQGALTHEGSVDGLRASLGKAVRLTEEASAEGDPPRVHWVDTVEEAQGLARRQGLQAFSIGRASLEDLYLRLAESRPEPAAVVEQIHAA